MWSRDHYLSTAYSKYLKQTMNKRETDVEIVARATTNQRIGRTNVEREAREAQQSETVLTLL